MLKRVKCVDTAVNQEYVVAIEEAQKDTRQLVLDGLKQVREGKTKDFNDVCDGLEKKYTNAAV